MAAGILPKPGSKYGPCKKKCEHIDCQRTRFEAWSKCRICNEAIGYNVRFYREDNNGLVHANCLEDEVDRQEKERSDRAMLAVKQVAEKYRNE